jgi:hypothetical protein
MAINIGNASPSISEVPNSNLNSRTFWYTFFVVFLTSSPLFATYNSQSLFQFLITRRIANVFDKVDGYTLKTGYDCFLAYLPTQGYGLDDRAGSRGISHFSKPSRPTPEAQPFSYSMDTEVFSRGVKRPKHKHVSTLTTKPSSLVWKPEHVAIYCKQK